MENALLNGDLTVLSNAAGSSAVNDEGWFSVSGNSLTDNGETPAFASMYTVLFDSSTANSASAFLTTDIIDVEITDGIIASEAEFYWDQIDVPDAASSSWQTIGSAGGEGGGGSGAVPEPTSGLLMLLGVAGLALRRKQA